LQDRLAPAITALDALVGSGQTVPTCGQRRHFSVLDLRSYFFCLCGL